MEDYHRGILNVAVEAGQIEVAKRIIMIINNFAMSKNKNRSMDDTVDVELEIL